MPTRELREPEFDQPWLLLIAGVLVAGVAGLIGRRLGQGITSDGGSWEHAVLTVLRRAEIWGVIGLALGAWLGFVRTRSREALGVALTGVGVGVLAGALGGLVVAPTDVVDSVKQDPGLKDVLQAVSLAVEGGLIGALIGRFWRPPSGTLGLAAGVAGGVLAFLASDWDIQDSQSFASVAQVGVQAMVIAACAITAMIFLGRRLSR